MSSLMSIKKHRWLIAGAVGLILVEILWGGTMMTASAGDAAKDAVKEAVKDAEASGLVAPLSSTTAPVVRTAIEEYEIPAVVDPTATVSSATATEAGYAITLVNPTTKETWLLLYKAGEKQPFKMAHFTFAKK